MKEGLTGSKCTGSILWVYYQNMIVLLLFEVMSPPVGCAIKPLYFLAPHQEKDHRRCKKTDVKMSLMSPCILCLKNPQ